MMQHTHHLWEPNSDQRKNYFLAFGEGQSMRPWQSLSCFAYSLWTSVPAEFWEVLMCLDNIDFLWRLDIILPCRLPLLQAEQNPVLSTSLHRRDAPALWMWFLRSGRGFLKLEEFQTPFFHDQLQCCTFPWLPSKCSAAESHVFHSYQCVIIQLKYI